MDEDDLLAKLNQLTATQARPNLGDVFEGAAFRKAILNLDPIKGAAHFSALTLCPELQSNLYRTEALVHVILGIANGGKEPNTALISRVFEHVNNSHLSHAEDPAEDVMVSLVYDKSHSYRLIEGLWTGNSYFVQKFIEVVDETPDLEPFTLIKTTINALLVLSEEIAIRADLPRYLSGNEIPQKKIPKNIVGKLVSLKNAIAFSEEDLNRLSINPIHLNPFIFSLDNRATLLDVEFGDTPLEKQPVVFYEGMYYVLLPSAIGNAIRFYLINIFTELGHKNSFLKAYQKNYVNSFSSRDVGLLREYQNVPFSPYTNSDGEVCGASSLIEIDSNRFVHFILAFDDFENFDDGWIHSHSVNSEKNNEAIEKQIRFICDRVSKNNESAEGLVVIASCGWGRSIMIDIGREDIDSWDITGMSAYDLYIFSLLPKMDGFVLWMLIKAEKRINELGVTIMNPNGVLNLYSWAMLNNYHLLPHDQLPDDLSPEKMSNFSIMIDLNALREARRLAFNGWDKHLVEDYNKRNIVVTKLSDSNYFIEDASKPIYASVTDILNKKLLLLVNGRSFRWWCKPKNGEYVDRGFIYKIWSGVGIWLDKIDSVLDGEVTSSRLTNIIWTFDFTSFSLPSYSDHIPNYDELIEKSEVSINEDIHSLYIVSKFNDDFTLGFHREDNFAEKAMMHSLVEGIIQSKSIQLRLNAEEIIDRVFRNPDAKNIHLLKMNHFLDFVKDQLPKPIFVDSFEDATSRIGLGFLALDPDDNRHIQGVTDCIKYLRDLVDAVWFKVKTSLKKFNKAETIKILLLNHESIIDDTEHWHRTFRATLAIHEDKDNVYSAVSRELSQRNMGSLATRIAIEFACCECLEEGGVAPGKFEIINVIANASLLFHLGNWSDSIRYEMVPPEVKVSPAGDILIDQTFNEVVMSRYGEAMQGVLLDASSKDYSKYFTTHESRESTIDLLGVEFCGAWEEEFGFGIDVGREILDLIDNEGEHRKTPILELGNDEYLDIVTRGNVSRDEAESFLSAMSLPIRDEWTDVPEGYTLNDILPWRFRRRLSLISKPILNIASILYVPPSLLRSGFMYTFRTCYDADFEDGKFTSASMRKWIGTKRNAYGHEFNDKTAAEFRKNGYEALANMELTELLNKKLDKNYGDMDVVAWSPHKKTIMLIECKDLSFAKTHSEVSKQVYEFRGVVSNNGKPDRLLKHLNRIDKIRENESDLFKTLNLPKKTKIIGCILFSNLTPISFSSFDEINKVSVHSFSDIPTICS